MAEMDDVLAELRHRIMGSLKPARPQHQETNGEGPATTQPVNVEQRRGSAAVALRRLAHPGRDGRDGGAVVADELSELIRRLSIDMPELLEEVVVIAHGRGSARSMRSASAASSRKLTLVSGCAVA